MNYIFKIRRLLNQTLDAYKSGNYAKAKELATTAYIDNFEFIEKSISSDLKHQDEDFKGKIKTANRFKVLLMN